MLTQDKIEQLRKTVAHAGVADIGAELTEKASPEFIEDLQVYLNDFAAHKRCEDGTVDPDYPCLACGQRHAFTWGLAHGAGHCAHCGWPARLYHFVKDRDGKDLVTFRHVVLQYHPDGISLRSAAEQEPTLPDPLPDYPAEQLLKRAVRGSRDRQSRKGQKHPRWVAVMDTFALGSSYSRELCRWAGVDPDETVKR